MKDTRQTEARRYTMPVVVRARAFYVYDRYGARYIDFFQNHGRAVLGHRPSGMQQAIKATVARGLVADYPSVYEGRLEKLLARLFPGYAAFRIYGDRRYAEQVALSRFPEAKAIGEPAGDALEALRLVSYWRPFLEVGGVMPALLLPILPFPGSFAPQVVCLRDPALADELPPSDIVSPMLLDLLVKATADLLSELQEKERVDARMDNPLASVFRTRGPYGFTDFPPLRYGEFVKKALELHVVLPPDETIPFIVPGTYNPGDVGPFFDLAKACKAMI